MELPTAIVLYFWFEPPCSVWKWQIWRFRIESGVYFVPVSVWIDPRFSRLLTQYILSVEFITCCNDYHYCTASFNKAWALFQRRFKSNSRRVGDMQWWESFTIVPLEIRLNAFVSQNSAKSIHFIWPLFNDRFFTVISNSKYGLWNAYSFRERNEINTANI